MFPLFLFRDLLSISCSYKIHTENSSKEVGEADKIVFFVFFSRKMESLENLADNLKNFFPIRPVQRVTYLKRVTYIFKKSPFFPSPSPSIR